MLIDENHPAAGVSSRRYWMDTLENKRILHYELQKAIYALTKDNKKSYSMDTGQTTINVTMHDLPSLYDRLGRIEKEIADLEDQLGLNKKSAMFQGVMSW